MRSRKRSMRLSVVAATLLAVGSWGAAPTAVADESAVEYVNLGDSFSAGSGVLPLAPGAPVDCLQSERNFAHIIASEQGYDLTDVSCGGAATDDFYTPQRASTRPQFEALSPSTDVVTVMIGGNDGSVFAGAISSCIGALATDPGVPNPCEQQNGSRFVDTIVDTTLPAVRQALRDIHTRAPEAKVVIVGYPWLLPATDTCSPLVPVATGDVPFLRTLQSTLNDAIEQAAAETRTSYVDLSGVSEGRDACQPAGVRWVEPLLLADQPVPLHPNALGEAAIAAEVTEALTSS